MISTPTSARMGAAISTTGDSHRMAFLETTVRGWRMALPSGSPLFVTVDGSKHCVEQVVQLMAYLDHTAFRGETVQVYRVGQPNSLWSNHFGVRDDRLGVAANKNTGIELLMAAGVEHLFLSDDDTNPLRYESLQAHTDQGLVHSMLGWGKHRRVDVRRDGDTEFAVWSWPRGVVLYQHRSVIERLGGMDEAFGPGGHEHVEFSRRVHQAGLTPAPYVSPVEYAQDHARGALRMWHAEDIPFETENRSVFMRRKNAQTSVRRRGTDWTHIEAIMARRNGDTSFVPYVAADNRRMSGTLSWT